MKLRGAPLAATAAVLTVAGTYVAAQIDYVRRHTPGVSPARYLAPQARVIWLPGLALAAALGVLAWWLGRRAR